MYLSYKKYLKKRESSAQFISRKLGITQFALQLLMKKKCNSFGYYNSFVRYNWNDLRWQVKIAQLMQAKPKTFHKMKYSVNSTAQESIDKPSYSSISKKQDKMILILSYSGAKNERNKIIILKLFGQNRSILNILKIISE